MNCSQCNDPSRRLVVPRGLPQSCGHCPCCLVPNSDGFPSHYLHHAGLLRLPRSSSAVVGVAIPTVTTATSMVAATPVATTPTTVVQPVAAVGVGRNMGPGPRRGPTSGL